MARSRTWLRWVIAGVAAVVIFAVAVVASVGLTFWLEPVATLRTVQQWQVDGALGAPTMVSTPNGDLAMWTAGDGDRTVVLIHGFGDSAAGWVPVATALSKSHRVVVVDLPGHGRSHPEQAPLTFNQLAVGLDAALSSIDGPVDLVGNSLGGWLAARWTVEHPERVHALYLVNAAGLPREIDRETLLPTTTEGMRRKMDIILGEHSVSPPDFVVHGMTQMHADPRLHSLFDDLQAHPQHVGEGLSLNPTPLTFVWGTPDAFFPQDPYLASYQRLRPDAQTVLLEGCGHAPQYSCPEGLVEVLEGP